MVTVLEDVGVREICASVLHGILIRAVIVNVVYADEIANARGT